MMTHTSWAAQSVPSGRMLILRFAWTNALFTRQTSRRNAPTNILTALQRLFTKAGYRTDRKHVPHSRGLKKADLLIKDFQLQGVRDVIVDVTCRHEFRGSCANQERNGEPSYLDVNGALDAAVTERPRLANTWKCRGY